MDTTTENEIISRLKFIGKIQQGDKINVKYMCIQPDTYYTKLSRTIFNQDSRSNTLNFLRNTVHKSFHLINKYIDTDLNNGVLIKSDGTNLINKKKCENILSDLKKSTSGLICIKDTYLHDIKFICDIDTLLQEINLKILEIDSNNNNTDDETDENNDIEI
jgi:hypothetical protein